MKRLTEGIFLCSVLFTSQSKGNFTLMQMVYFKCKWFRFETTFPSVTVKVTVRGVFSLSSKAALIHFLNFNIG